MVSNVKVLHKHKNVINPCRRDKGRTIYLKMCGRNKNLEQHKQNLLVRRVFELQGGKWEQSFIHECFDSPVNIDLTLNSRK